MSDIAIKVENLSKKYIIGSGTSGSLRETLSNTWHNTFGGKRTDEEVFWALQDINFEIKQGEAVGIIGRNGAGKSTLLKLLSKITYPTTGKITMNGRVSSLLEVGTGFHPELTGRENIYLNGTILGMSRREVKSKFDEIVDFSGVEKFLDTPVKRYSSGMYVRLAFAVAAHLEPEILIIDEVLAVGDAEFQKKCLGKMDEVAKGGRTVLFVSHNMGAIKDLCTNGILLNRGRIEEAGITNDVIKTYLHSSTIKVKTEYGIRDFVGQRGTKQIRISKIELNKSSFFPNDDFKVSVNLNFDGLIKEIEDLNISLKIFDANNILVYHLSNYYFTEFKRIPLSSKNRYSFYLSRLSLKPGNYRIVPWIYGNKDIQHEIKEGINFLVEDGNIYTNSSVVNLGIVQPEFKFKIEI